MADKAKKVHLSATCRICAQEFKQLAMMKQTFERAGIKMTIKEMYNACISEKVPNEELFPQSICLGCLRDLIKFFEFKKKCVESLRKFHNITAETKRKAVEATPVEAKKKIKVEATTSKAAIETTKTKPVKQPKKQNRLMQFLIEEEEQNSGDGGVEVVRGEDVVIEEEVETTTVVGEIVVEEEDSSEKVDSPEPEPSPDYGDFKYKMYRDHQNASRVILEANGYLYKTSANVTKRCYLKCQTHPDCPAKAYIELKEKVQQRFITVYDRHNHPKVPMEIEQLKFFETLHRISNSGYYTAEKIYEIAIQKYPNLKDRVSLEAVFSRLQKMPPARKSNVTVFVVQGLQTFIDFFEASRDNPIRFTRNGEKLYQESINDECGRALIFTNVALLESMSFSNEIFVDSSFVVKFINGERFIYLTISLAVNEYKYPVFYVLLDNENEELYRRIFTLFRDKYACNLLPEDIVTDFNLPLYKALSSVYKHSAINGSLIHYMIHVYLQTCMFGLKATIENSPECIHIQSYIYSLPVLPPEHIPEGLEFIKKTARAKNLYDTFERIFEYVDQTWIGHVTPQVFSTYRNLVALDDNIGLTFKKMRNIIITNRVYGCPEIYDKLILLEDWVRNNYESKCNKERPAHIAALNKYRKVFDTLWHHNHVDKYGFDGFFDALQPFIEKMTGLLWIWGFYNYESRESKPLISPNEYYETEATRQTESLSPSQ